jgi:hypothetical protein
MSSEPEFCLQKKSDCWAVLLLKDGQATWICDVVDLEWAMKIAEALNNASDDKAHK